MLVEAQETVTEVIVEDVPPLAAGPLPQPDAHMQADKTQNEPNCKIAFDN